MDTQNTWVNFTVTRGPIRGKDRNRVGLLIQVQARRDVEEFMSGLAHGRRVQVDAIGDSWQSCTPGGESLECYDVDAKLEGPRVYTLDQITGPPLIEGNHLREARGLGAAVDIVNLSFLRLVGISNESGVTVGINGAYSGDYIRRLKTLLPAAVKQFLQDYLVPVTINLQVISRG